MRTRYASDFRIRLPTDFPSFRLNSETPCGPPLGNDSQLRSARGCLTGLPTSFRKVKGVTRTLRRVGVINSYRRLRSPIQKEDGSGAKVLTQPSPKITAAKATSAIRAGGHDEEIHHRAVPQFSGKLSPVRVLVASDTD